MMTENEQEESELWLHCKCCKISIPTKVKTAILQKHNKACERAIYEWEEVRLLQKIKVVLEKLKDLSDNKLDPVQKLEPESLNTVPKIVHVQSLVQDEELLSEQEQPQVSVQFNNTDENNFLELQTELPQIQSVQCSASDNNSYSAQDVQLQQETIFKKPFDVIQKQKNIVPMYYTPRSVDPVRNDGSTLYLKIPSSGETSNSIQINAIGTDRIAFSPETAQNLLQAWHKRGPSRDTQAEFENIGFNTNTGSYLCHNCPETFRSEQELFSHLEKHDNSEGSVCTQCTAKFSDLASLTVHIFRCHHQIQGIHRVLGSRTPPRKVVETVVIDDGDEDEVQLLQVVQGPSSKQLADCAVSPAKTRENTMSASSSQYPHQCNTCRTKFKNPSHLAIHLNAKTKCVSTNTQRLEQNDKRHCSSPNIGEILRSSPLYQESSNLPKISQNIGQYRCRACSMQLSSKITLKNHELRVCKILEETIVDRSKYQFSCDKCPEKFKADFNLKKHLSGHGDRIQCNICGSGFNTIQGCKIHQNRAHGVSKKVPELPPLHTGKKIMSVQPVVSVITQKSNQESTFPATSSSTVIKLASSSSEHLHQQNPNATNIGDKIMNILADYSAATNQVIDNTEMDTRVENFEAQSSNPATFLSNLEPVVESSISLAHPQNVLNDPVLLRNLQGILSSPEFLSAHQTMDDVVFDIVMDTS